MASATKTHAQIGRPSGTDGKGGGGGVMASKSNSTRRTPARTNGRGEWSSPRTTQAAVRYDDTRPGEERPAYKQSGQAQGAYSNYVPDYEAEAERRRNYSLPFATPAQHTLTNALPGMEEGMAGAASSAALPAAKPKAPSTYNANLQNGSNQGDNNTTINQIGQ